MPRKVAPEATLREVCLQSVTNHIDLWCKDYVDFFLTEGRFPTSPFIHVPAAIVEEILYTLKRQWKQLRRHHVQALVVPHLERVDFSHKSTEYLPFVLELTSTRCQHLKSLNVSHNYQISDWPLKVALPSFPLLQELNLASSHFTDEVLACLGAYNPELRTLILTDCTRVTDAGISSLCVTVDGGSGDHHKRTGRCKKMVHLALRGTKVGPAGVRAALENMPALRSLQHGDTATVLGSIRRESNLSVGSPRRSAHASCSCLVGSSRHSVVRSSPANRPVGSTRRSLSSRGEGNANLPMGSPCHMGRGDGNCHCSAASRRPLQDLFLEASEETGTDTLALCLEACPDVTRVGVTKLFRARTDVLEPLRQIKGLVELSVDGGCTTEMEICAFRRHIMPALDCHWDTLSCLHLRSLAHVSVELIGSRCANLNQLHLHHITSYGPVSPTYFAWKPSAREPPPVLFPSLRKFEFLGGSKRTDNSEQTLRGALVSPRLNHVAMRFTPALNDQLMADVLARNKFAELVEWEMEYCNNVTATPIKMLLGLNNPMRALKMWECRKITQADAEDLWDLKSKNRWEISINLVLSSLW